ncbi:MAG TPA: TIM barrel protein, partial [Xanthobacteraceae bacterium]|nr:TIM barrel protein [Xanthobacteraceae bacterium]
VKRVHLMAGLADRRDPKAVAAYRRAVAWTAERLAEIGLDLVLEPINGRNMPGYFLDDFAFAESLIDELDLANLKLQFDIYHRQILHGDVTVALRRMMRITGHVQIASVPSRHEPAGEELNYPFLFAELDRLGYDGFVGCEYNPRAGTREGLGWFAPYAAAPRRLESRT